MPTRSYSPRTMAVDASPREDPDSDGSEDDVDDFLRRRRFAQQHHSEYRREHELQSGGCRQSTDTTVFQARVVQDRSETSRNAGTDREAEVQR